MSKKALVGLSFGAGLIAFLAVLYGFYPSGAPQVSLGKPDTPREVQYRTAPEFAGKPGAPGSGGPPVQEPPAPPAAQASPTPAEPPVVAAAEPETPQSEAVPEEQFGLLVGRYRTHQDATRVMEKVQKEGKPAFIRHDGRQRQPYALWVGPFPNQEESKIAARAIKAKLKVAAKVEKLQMVIPK